MSENIYDVVILGGGAAGLTAGIYASRAKLDTLLIEKGYPGGQIMMCETIENFPGFPNGTSGMDLANAIREQAERFGMQTKFAEIIKVDFKGNEKSLFTADGEEIKCKTVILSLGAKPRMLRIPGEGEFIGRGVSYCAVCDGAFFKDKKLAVIGGGDTAVEDAIFLTRFGTEVNILHRRDKLRAQKIIQERALANPKIKIHWNTVATQINGDQLVQSIDTKNVVTGETGKLEVDGVFVLVGTHPNTEFIRDQINLDENNYIYTDENMLTNIPGVFAAGDVRHKMLRQIITAAADGAIAATAAEKYIEGGL